MKSHLSLFYIPPLFVLVELHKYIFHVCIHQYYIYRFYLRVFRITLQIVHYTHTHTLITKERTHTKLTILYSNVCLINTPKLGLVFCATTAVGRIALLLHLRRNALPTLQIPGAHVQQWPRLRDQAMQQRVARHADAVQEANLRGGLLVRLMAVHHSDRLPAGLALCVALLVELLENHLHGFHLFESK